MSNVSPNPAAYTECLGWPDVYPGENSFCPATAHRWCGGKTPRSAPRLPPMPPSRPSPPTKRRASSSEFRPIDWFNAATLAIVLVVVAALSLLSSILWIQSFFRL